MTEERLSRRGFLKAFLVATGGTMGIIAAKEIYPFTGLLSLRGKDGEVAAEDFLQLVEVSENLPKVALNTSAFSKALLHTAAYILPENGPSRLKAVLEKKPLRVVLDPNSPGPFSWNNKLYYPSAHYTPFFFGGPEIRFFKHFLENYSAANKNLDIASQVKNDATVWHEIIHLVQDIKNPLELSITTSLYGLRDGANSLGLIDQHNSADDPAEKEAIQKSSEIVELKFNEYLLDGKPENWPFGQFFTFG
ncbi:MAG: hypothetical protein WBD86_01685 [Microgenomates group bacterium]